MAKHNHFYEEIFSNKFKFSNGIFYFESDNFKYSDGNKPERYVQKIIENTKDISSDSKSLEHFIKDWPSKYHLSSTRANCYRAMNFKKGASVLEIGSGCGSITRYLGETFESVIALEGSERRAQITRSRTRDLDNVMVVCSPFEKVVFNKKFDYIICNGVLEYASFFTNGPNPTEQFLAAISDLLSSNGSLIVAIENKFGLRYFSSSREEHTGLMHDGLEDYASHPKGARTFGSMELFALLNNYFSSVEKFIPLPDYKLPIGLISEDLLTEVNCAELFAVSDNFDFGTFETPLMNERLVWSSLADAGLLPEFTNSLLFIAGAGKSNLFEHNWLGTLYAGNRKKEFITKTNIIKSEIGNVEVLKERVAKHSDSKNSKVRHIELTDVWIDGPSIHSLLSREFMRKDKGTIFEKSSRIIADWWKLFKDQLDQFNQLDGAFIDCIWQNSIATKDGVIAIDREWEWHERIPALLLVYRSVISFIEIELKFCHRWERKNRNLNQRSIIKSISSECGIKFSDLKLLQVIMLNNEFLHQTSYSRQSVLRCFIRLYMPIFILQKSTVLKRVTKKIASRVINRIFK